MSGVLELEVEIPAELAGDLATRIMSGWPDREIRTDGPAVTLLLPIDDRLDQELARFESMLQALEKTRNIEELSVQSRNLAGPDSGPAVIELGRFIIRRPEAVVRTRPGRIILTLESGPAFGTGSHPSTALSLSAIEEYFAPGPGAPGRTGCRVLDVGTGSGILALAAASLGAGMVTAVDVSVEALAVAERNATRNDLSEHMEFPRTSVEKVQGTFALILANLVPAVLLRLGRKLAPLLAPDGRLIVAGFADSQTPQVVGTLTKAGLATIKSYSRGGWSALALERDA